MIFTEKNSDFEVTLQTEIRSVISHYISNFCYISFIQYAADWDFEERVKIEERENYQVQENSSC